MTEINTEATVTPTDPASAPGAEITTLEGEDPSPDTTESEINDEEAAVNSLRLLAEEDPPGDEDGDEPEPEPEADAEEDAEPDAEAPPEEEGSTIPGLAAELKKLSPNMAKRVEGLFKEVPSLKAENAKLAEELEQAHTLPVHLSRTVADPLADVRTEEELTKALSYAQEIKRFGKKYPDGGTFQGREIDLDQLQIMDDWADAALIQSDSRRKYLQTYEQTVEFAKAVMPDVLNPKPQLGKALQEHIKKQPHVVESATYLGGFICMARGAAMLQAERDGYKWVKVKAGETAPAATNRRNVPAQTTASNIPLRGATGRRAIDPALQARIEDGDEAAIRASLMADV